MGLGQAVPGNDDRARAPRLSSKHPVTMNAISRLLPAGLVLALALNLGAQNTPAPAAEPAAGTPPQQNVPPPAPSEPVVVPPLPAESNVPNPAGEGPASPAPVARNKKAAAPRLPKGHFNLRGTVKTSDTNAMSLTITAKSKEHVVRFDGQSRAERAGEPAVFRSIQAGDTFQGEVRQGPKGAEILVQGHFKPAKTPAAP